MKTIVTAALLSITLLLGVSVAPKTFAMGGYTSDQMLTGTVQSIDYLHHSITVNGETYAVSATAKFTGIGGFSVLHIGMPVECMLSSSSDADPDNETPSSAVVPVIIAVTWVPAGT